MFTKETFLKNNIWRCPSCASTGLREQESGKKLSCERCQTTFLKDDDTYIFLNTAGSYDKQSNGLRDFFKRWPRFYYTIVILFGPVFFMGLSPKKFLKKYCSESPVFNLGSGPRIISPEVINVDLFPYEGVSIVADIGNLPLSDASSAGIICADVFEHVSDPERVVQELFRVLKPQACAYISVPFMYPFHASPHDFNRWTEPGLDRLLSGFAIVKKGVRSGPFSTLTVNLCYLVATLFSFGNKSLYWLLVNMATFIFFPIKYLDSIFGHLPFAINMAAEVYYVIQKK